MKPPVCCFCKKEMVLDPSIKSANFKEAYYCETCDRYLTDEGVFIRDISYKRPKKPKLIPCSACGQQISEQATACPHCGQPTGVIMCPKCKSTDTKVISGANKAISVGLFGIFAANTVTSKYQCKKCGHKF